MKGSDFIVEFLIKKGITEVFGYPGGMVTHLMDSFSKYEKYIHAHVSYHEQAAAFAACGYAQASGKIGVAYATSGPGATNLVTGICNAYFDSIPVIFITGQVNTFESKQNYKIRQRGFQETNIVDMVKNVTKYAVYVDSVDKLGECLEKAYQVAMSGRKGPVLLDIPMDVQRMQMQEKGNSRLVYSVPEQKIESNTYDLLVSKLQAAKRPCVLLGAGAKGVDRKKIRSFIEHMKLPIVTSMIARELLPYEHPLNYGFIGAYGDRTANFIVAKSDLILTIGSRLDVRQTGGKRAAFAPTAQIIRVDIDAEELEYKVREDEIDIHGDAGDVMEFLMRKCQIDQTQWIRWNSICNVIAEKLNGYDESIYNIYTKKISQHVSSDAVITTDVGQNQVWVAQSFQVKDGQQILFSGGHGAMGYALPAAIGAYYATGREVICFSGDGGMQMNIQELEFIRREKLPIKIYVYNNHALGMIRHFQEMYFDNNNVQTIHGNGYTSPDFEKLAVAYDIPYFCYEKVDDVSDVCLKSEGPALVEIRLFQETYVFPKLEFGKPNQDQKPQIARELYDEIMAL